MLCVDGVSVRELAAQYGTPCYVYSQTRVQQNCVRLQEAFRGRCDFFYAIKVTPRPVWGVLIVPVTHACVKGTSCLLRVPTWWWE